VQSAEEFVRLPNPVLTHEIINGHDLAHFVVRRIVLYIGRLVSCGVLGSSTRNPPDIAVAVAVAELDVKARVDNECHGYPFFFLLFFSFFSPRPKKGERFV
jgi:hypothetical protein